MNWKWILTYGFTLDLFGCGNKRKLVDRETGRVVVIYTFKEVQ